MRYFGKRGRITSLALAAAMALSAFAGLNAAAADEEAASAEYAPTEKYEQDFETGNDFLATNNSNMHRVHEDAIADVLLSSTNYILGVRSGVTAYKNLPNIYSGATSISFDFKFDPGVGENSVFGQNHLYLTESISADGSPVNTMLDLSVTATGNGQFNGNVSVNDTATFSSGQNTGSNFRQSQSNLVTNGNRDSTRWLHLEALLDFDLHEMDLTITKAYGNKEQLYHNKNLAFEKSASSFKGIAIYSHGKYGGTYIDNIVVKDAPVVSAIEITGTVNGDAGTSTSTPERVYTNHSATYTAVAYDQYGDICDNNLTLTTSQLPANVTFLNNTLNVGAVTGYNEITLTAQSGEVTKTKTVAAIASDVTISATTIPVSADSYIYGADRIDSGTTNPQGKPVTLYTPNPQARTVNHGTDTELHVNMAENVLDNAVSGLKEPTKVALFKFDYKNVDHGYIKDGTVLSAVLHYYAKKESSYSAYPYFCHVTYDDWAENTVTWETPEWVFRNSNSSSNTAHFRKPYIYADKQPTANYEKYSVDVTEFFSADTDGKFINDGILSIGCATRTAREIMIASKEYTPANGAPGDYGAYLEIEYIPPRSHVSFTGTPVNDGTVTVSDDYNSTVGDSGIDLSARDYDYYAIRPGYETTLSSFTVTVDECNAGTPASPNPKNISYTLTTPTATPNTNSNLPKTKTASLFNESENNLYYVGNRYGATETTSNPVPSQFLRVGETIVMEFDIFVAKMTGAYFTLGNTETVGPELKFSADANTVTVTYGSNAGTQAGIYSTGQWAHIRLETTTTSSSNESSGLRLKDTNAEITPAFGEKITISHLDERNLAASYDKNKTFDRVIISGANRDTGGGAVIRNSEIYVLAEQRQATAYFVPESDSTDYPYPSLSPVAGKVGGKLKGSTIATAFVSQSYVQGATATTCLAWDVTVPKDGTYVRMSSEENAANAVAGTASVQKDNLGYTIYSASKGFSLKLKYAVPAISGSGAVVCGLVLDDLYAPGATANVAYLTSINDESLRGYDTLTLGAASGSVYTPTTKAVESETDALSELMSIDSILTMMYTDDELAEITGDIASEDNAAASGIDDGIDMTDAEDTGEAVGDME